MDISTFRNMSRLHFHREIEFDILRTSETAMLIQVKKVKSSKFNRFAKLKSIQKIIKPLEVWIPQSWVKKDMWVSCVGCPGNMERWETTFWIWEEGFLKNVKELCEKRKAVEEGVDYNFF